MCDRGANLLKALQDYEVLNCFPHHMNNILKRAFFQSKNNQTSAKTPITVQATTSADADIDQNDSSDSSSSTQDEELFKPRKQIKKKRRKRQSPISNANDPMKLKLEDLPVKAQEIIETIKQYKKLVRYIKKVMHLL